MHSHRLIKIIVLVVGSLASVYSTDVFRNAIPTR